MEKLKSVNDIPTWFKERKYRKNLSDVEWFEEIQGRSCLGQFLENFPMAGLKERNRFMEVLTLDLDVGPFDFSLPTGAEPISDLIAGEVAYLRSCLKSNVSVDSTLREYEELISTWAKFLEEYKRVGSFKSPKLSRYNLDIYNFVGKVCNKEKSPNFHYSVANEFDNFGNPLSPYGRPLNGQPVTINLDFDDETILGSVKSWLKEKRKSDGLQARRPFNQNDFDDWEHYKLREAFDLDTWAAASGVKILDRVMASALWPNAADDVSPLDMLRTTTRKKTKEIFCYATKVRLCGQLKRQQTENFSDG